nr:Ku protein [Streptomyces sp. GESEQ-35]
MAIAKYAWSGRERLGLLRIRDDVIVLHGMRWPDEVRDPSELLPPAVQLSDQEVDQALALIDRMTTETLQGPDFTDHYTEALQQVLDAKREGHALPEAPTPEKEPGQVLDLMAALKESVTKAKASRGEGTDAEVHGLPPKKTAARKGTAKKQSAKKAAAKKTTAKKTSGRRPRTA